MASIMHQQDSSKDQSHPLAKKLGGGQNETGSSVPDKRDAEVCVISMRPARGPDDGRDGPITISPQADNHQVNNSQPLHDCHGQATLGKLLTR